MDIKMNLSPEEILNSMDKFYKMLTHKDNTQNYELLKKWITTIAIAIASTRNEPVFAADMDAPKGMISYT